MKILFTQETYKIRSNVNQQQRLAEMLIRQGHEVRVIDNEILKRSESKKSIVLRRRLINKGDKGQKDISAIVIYPGFIRIPLLNLFSSFISHRREINRQIEEFKPEVIVGWSIINSYLAANAAERTISPLFIIG